MLRGCPGQIQWFSNCVPWSWRFQHLGAKRYRLCSTPDPQIRSAVFPFFFFIFDLFHILDFDLFEEQLPMVKNSGKKDSLDQLIPKLLTPRRSAVHLEQLSLSSLLAGLPRNAGGHKTKENTKPRRTQNQGAGERRREGCDQRLWQPGMFSGGLCTHRRSRAQSRAAFWEGPSSLQLACPACAQEPCISVQSPCCRMCCSSPLTTSSVSSLSSTMSYESM